MIQQELQDLVQNIIILVKDPNKLSPVFHEAFTIAQDGRPGPVLIDIPKDVQFAKGNYIEKEKIIIPSHRLFEPEIFHNDEKINEVVRFNFKSKETYFLYWWRMY